MTDRQRMQFIETQVEEIDLTRGPDGVLKQVNVFYYPTGSQYLEEHETKGTRVTVRTALDRANRKCDRQAAKK